jgi:hypothetical protein
VMPLIAAKYCPPLLKHTSRQPLMGIWYIQAGHDTSTEFQDWAVQPAFTPRHKAGAGAT